VYHTPLPRVTSLINITWQQHGLVLLLGSRETSENSMKQQEIPYRACHKHERRQVPVCLKMHNIAVIEIHKSPSSYMLEHQNYTRWSIALSHATVFSLSSSIMDGNCCTNLTKPWVNTTFLKFSSIAKKST
jgi:hypothetical protein